MTDLAAEGDRLHALFYDEDGRFPFDQWARDNWPAIAAALREVAVAWEAYEKSLQRCDALRVRAETAEARVHDMGIAWEKDIERAETAEARESAAVNSRPSERLISEFTLPPWRPAVTTEHCRTCVRQHHRRYRSTRP